MSEVNTPELPANWERSTIGVVVEEKVSQSGPTAGDEFTYVDISSIDNRTKRIISPKAIRREEAPSRARQVLETGDVLVSMTRPNLNAVALIASDLDQSIGSTGFDILRSKFAEPFWLFYAVQTNDFVQAMCRAVQGALYPAVRPHDIRSYLISLPPLAEQRRIVAKLEELFSDLDAGVAALERAKVKLKRYRAAVLKAAVEGRLTAEWREKHPATEPASELLDRILAERRKRWEADQEARFAAAGKTPPKNWREKYVEPTPPDASNLPELPGDWCWATVEQLLETGPQNGAYYPKTMYGDGIPILRIDDYQQFWSRASEEAQCVDAPTSDRMTYGLMNHDLLINRVNSLTHLGKVLLVESRHLPAIFESNMMRLRFGESLVASFLRDYLRSPAGVQRLTANAKWAVNQASINQQDVQAVPVPLPPLVEQERIASEIEYRLSVISMAEKQIIANFQRAIRLRQSILKQAFAGKLVPQDPHDEPASVLLERIRAERKGGTMDGAKKPRRIRNKPQE